MDPCYCPNLQAEIKIPENFYLLMLLALFATGSNASTKEIFI